MGNHAAHNHPKQIYTNTHDNKNQYIVRHMQHIYKIINMSMLMYPKTCKYIIKAP